MKFFTIQKLQKEQGYDQIQYLIDSGAAWKMEGAIGRAAMDALRSGACYLANVSYRDAYGNKIPSRGMVKPGTTGSWQNTVKFYTENPW